MRVTQLAHSGASHASSDLTLGKGLCRLLTAAVVNREFCSLLLANPAMAVAIGYNGEPFDLAAEEQELIISINATSLADFAKQLTKNGNGRNGHNYNSNGYGHNGYRSDGFKEKVCGHE